MPDSTLWQHLTTLLNEATALDADARTAYLDGLEDEALRAELAELLAAHDEAETLDLFETPAFGTPALAFETDARVGPYRLVGEIGRGGMGMVYRAERADGQFEQAVALKLLPPGLGSAVSAERFRAERQILARLDHPHVAHLLDGGVTAGPFGRELPWLAMELVEGEPITAYAARRRLPAEARLRLFLQVCEAVQYAHQRLVVHRDLKPSNILIAEDAKGRPHAKLLDFGIATLVGDEAAGTPLTRTGVRPMTPEYAAPEQIRGEPVSTTTDVYALGVVLYELLAGQRPYDLAGQSPGEVERMVCETIPAKPSTAARAAGDGSLAQRLRGDLDTIALKALAKEPAQRYASAEALADDLRRHLDGLPVRARPATAGYRTRKFIRRHRVSVAAAVLVVLALVGGAVVSLWQARVARTEASKAEAVNAFLLDMLASPDPYADGPEVRVVDVLNRTRDRVEGQFDGQPEVEAAVHHTLGVTYHELGLYDEAGTHLRRALDLRERLLGPRHADVAETQGRLAITYQRQGTYEPADSLFRLALDTDRTLFGEEHTRLAHRLNDLGTVLWEQGDYDAAEPYLRDALALEERLRGPDHDQVAISLGNLATLLSDRGDYEEAERLYRRELAILRANHGDDHPSVPQALSHIGIIRDDLEDHAGAEALHTEALALFRRLKGEAHPDVGYAMNNLASAKTYLGAVEDAVALQREAAVIYEAALGSDHPNLGIQYNNMAATRRQQGDLAGAEADYRRAVGIWRAGLPQGHPYLGYGLSNLGAVLLAQERPREALPLLREAHDLRVGLLPPDNAERANTASILGDALGRLGDAVEAESLLVASYEALHQVLGADHAMTASAAERLGDFFRAQGRPGEVAPRAEGE